MVALVIRDCSLLIRFSTAFQLVDFHRLAAVACFEFTVAHFFEEVIWLAVLVKRLFRFTMNHYVGKSAPFRAEQILNSYLTHYR